MRRITKISAISAAALLVAAGVSATTASAAPQAQWTVSNPAANDAFSATNVAAVNAVLTNVTTGATITCSVYAASGTAVDGVYASGAGLATIANATFGTSTTKCNGPLGSKWVSQSVQPMKLNGVTYSGGVTKGTLTGVKVTLTGTSLLGTCNATIEGSANTGTYTNGTGVLEIVPDATPALTVTSASGSCAGLIKTGDKAKFGAKYQVSPVITVTSP
ncbi:hypothetical protein [Streptomyces lavendofoliae]|uniref:Secreted protein n=1 Tax=Streptomyces lavendofoliae TaxID=67314 RepID=A0A918HT63_9ACTN|nr:hypothetical protein [Streptomyces lavendofoliae]GGU23074.1 hypothetical protein GCM10010274_06780 [Streptomyces lavendofoliae]